MFHHTKMTPDKVKSLDVVPGIKNITTIGKNAVSLDDPRFRIRPMQQVASACTGAMLTATFSKHFNRTL